MTELTPEQTNLAAVLADHMRGDWSDRTYCCEGCRRRFENESQARWEAMTTDAERYAHRAELGRYIKPDWTMADYNAHVAEHLSPAIEAIVTARTDELRCELAATRIKLAAAQSALAACRDAAQKRAGR